MPKKCIPGVICIENMTFFMILFLCLVVSFLWFRVSSLAEAKAERENNTTKLLSSFNLPKLNRFETDVSRCKNTGGTVGDPLTNAYVPPIKCDSGGLIKQQIMSNIPSNSIPINIRTQHHESQYKQIGILTQKGQTSQILPLMGRRTLTSRNKWQYYTISGGGNGGLQTKLPIKVKGRACGSEYGCDEIFEGDEVFVEGLKDTFNATIYENGMFSYIPY